ncbi:protein involved in gliding motility GldD [Gillisia mitskevichiae]|uniref:Protein involved in gliding motility GldD n=1 Tax=Gillisia mitskevichiae TaxID=270921 RepID=A0A495PVH0_9FLAO|nr:gliding motility lipoprotein GldD [Gillisia mitskevichiae]RKS55195.1 protein involved in gliding motility GldD [Gillisia mitskevichiae]
MKRISIILLILSVFISCKDEVLPKPKAFLSLEFPAANYVETNLDCPYSFEINSMASIVRSKGSVPCWINLNYPKLNASVFITYQEVHNNLDSLLMDSQKLPLQHTIKADFIEGDVYVNPEHKTYGMFYEIDGDAASQAQFYVTDSVKHFMTGSLYFNQKPNFDSIMPAASYIKSDIKRLMESLKWN